LTAVNNPYRAIVDSFADGLTDEKPLGSAGLVRPRRSPVPAGAPTVLIFAPHPDDEVIIGGLPLRLLHELKLNVVNVAVTLGSREDRKAERWQELRNCCDYIGFGLVAPAAKGLEGIDAASREKDPQRWSASVGTIAELLTKHRPSAVFFPHDKDWNTTHIGVHHLLVEALRSAGLTCLVVETEFWGAMDTPNLMVESSAADVADLVAALSLHVGEVARNAFHLRLPAWMIDNVRRGAELVGGQGATAPQFPFATLYRLRRWENGRFHNAFEGGRVLSCQDDLSPLFLAP
jgi:LmbE family N-acetylglucosaminyl deacetylase